ncbi:MAG: PspA/IM30 family protein [Gammaproteobacteria bacterium]
MNTIKRLFVSIKSQIDHVADDFENHEALAAAAIEDLQAVAGKTRLQLHRLGKMSVHYAQQLQAQQEQARLWAERALKSRQQDEQKALQCVKRLRQTRRHIELLEQQCRETAEQEAKMRAELQAIQEQLQMLQSKKEILSARQHRACLHGAWTDSRSAALREAQSIFERWEGSVVGSEFEAPEDLERDSFAEAFEQEEDELALKAMLDELGGQHPPAEPT